MPDNGASEHAQRPADLRSRRRDAQAVRPATPDRVAEGDAGGSATSRSTDRSSSSTSPGSPRSPSGSPGRARSAPSSCATRSTASSPRSSTRRTTGAPASSSGAATRCCSCSTARTMRRARPAPAGRCSGRSSASAASRSRAARSPCACRSGSRPGKLDFFTAGSVHRELLITGPGATETVTIEAIADAGEIGISHALAALLDPACIGPAKEQALLLVAPPDIERQRAPDVGSVDGIDIASCIPIAARAHVLLERSEPEHRTITAAFIDLMDTDDLLAAPRPRSVRRGARRAHLRDPGGRAAVRRSLLRDGRRQGQREGAADRRRPVEHGTRRGANAAGAPRDHGSAGRDPDADRRQHGQGVHRRLRPVRTGAPTASSATRSTRRPAS